MKWLKKFEELSPELIRRAGNKLIDKGHSERGLDLLDKSYSGTEPFNIWITNAGNWIKRLPKGDSDRSEPLPLSYYFSSSKLYFFPRNMTYELNNEEMNPEKLIEYWKQGKCDLAFNIDFYFKPTKETIKSAKFRKSSFDEEVSLFNINFLIHKKIDNILIKKLSKDSVYIHEYFSKIYKDDIIISLDFPCIKDSSKDSKYDYGLFSDRKSALNFKNNILPKVMDEQGDKIMDILSIINIKSKKANDILQFYKKVKLNYLYRSEIPHYVYNSGEVDRYFFNKENNNIVN